MSSKLPVSVSARLSRNQRRTPATLGSPTLQLIVEVPVTRQLSSWPSSQSTTSRAVTRAKGSPKNALNTFFPLLAISSNTPVQIKSNLSSRSVQASSRPPCNQSLIRQRLTNRKMARATSSQSRSHQSKKMNLMNITFSSPAHPT